LFFSALVPATGRELWKSDGTDASTVLVLDINPGSANSSPSNLTNVNGTLFFSAASPGIGTELWKSDGTAEGTVLVRDINPGSNSSFLSELTAVGGTLFFSAFVPETETELWMSDGTPEGTMLVEDINPGPAVGASPGSLTNVGGILFFAATTSGTPGGELWLWAPPVTVASVVLNDGDPQRSSITSITVTFSDRVTIKEGAFELRNQDGVAIGLVLETSVVGGRTVAVVTFSGAGLNGSSLADGNYTLTLHSSLIRDRFGLGREIDADGDGLKGGDRVDAFFRLFGDSDGDRDVDLLDLGRFLGTLGRRRGDPRFLWYMDFDGDDRVGRT